MKFLIVLILIAIIIGALRGGTSFGDTLSKGCVTIIISFLIITAIMVLALM